MLPGTSWTRIATSAGDSFDFLEERLLESMRESAPVLPEQSDSSPFPWNPPNHRVDPLIGRDKELSTAHALLKEVVQQWCSHMVLVLGDQGVGKSTFVKRFQKEAPRIDPDLIWAQAFCRDEPTRPYAAIGWLLRSYMDTPPQLDEWMAGERLWHEVHEKFPNETEHETADIAHLIAFLVGFKIDKSPYLNPNEDDAQTLIPRASQALTRFFGRLAHNQPVVLVLDEAQQASGPLLSLIELMVEGLSSSPVLFLLVGQPELKNALPNWQDQRKIELKPMSRAATEKTLHLLLSGIDGIPKDLNERVIPKCAGNPYAVRAIVRYLHESGAIAPEEGGERWAFDESALFDLDIPNSLSGVAHARIQALDDRDRHILQKAAVIGPRFWFGQLVMLHRLSSEHSVNSVEGVGTDQTIVELQHALDSLVQREILQTVEDNSLPGETGFGFTSNLDHSVLYEQCPARVRHRFHRMIAHWLELQPADYVETKLASIARHLEIGGETWKAAQYYQRAGQSARAHFQNEEAIRYYEEALRLTGEEELANLEHLLFALGKLYASLGRNDEALDSYSRMLRYAWIMRSRSKGGVALSKMGQVYRSLGDYETARNHFVNSLQLFRSVYDDRGVAGVLDDMGQVAWLQGDVEQALVTYSKSKSLRTKLRDPRGLSLTLHSIASVYLDQGDYEAAETHLQDALEIRRKLRDEFGVCKSLSNLGVIYWGRGNAQQAEEAWRESLEIALTIGEMPLAANIMGNVAEAIAYRGEWEEACRLISDAVSIAERAGDRRTLGNLLVNQALTRMAYGEHALAMDCARRALEISEALGNMRIMGMAKVCHGDIMVGLSAAVGEAPGIQEGLSLVTEGIATLNQSGCHVDWAMALQQAADIYRKLDRLKEMSQTQKKADNAMKEHGIHPPQRLSVPWTAVALQTSSDEKIDDKAAVDAPAAKAKSTRTKTAGKKPKTTRKTASKKAKASSKTASKKTTAPKKKSAAKPKKKTARKPKKSTKSTTSDK